MYIEIITPDQKVYEGDVEAATFPGSKGSFQVLKSHAAMVSSLDRGPVILKTLKGEETIEIDGGVLEVLDDKVVVLAEGIIQ